jgi:hypothetical protein
MCTQVIDGGDPPAGFEDQDLGPDEVEAVGRDDPGQQLAFLEALFDDLDEFPAQFLEVGEVGRVYERKPLGDCLVMETPPRPDGKIVLVLGVVESWPEQAAPEMIVDTARGHGLQFVPEFPQGLSVFYRSHCDEGTVFHGEGIGNGYASLPVFAFHVSRQFSRPVYRAWSELRVAGENIRASS